MANNLSIVDTYGEITSAVDLGSEDFFNALSPSQKSEVYFKIQEMEGNIKKFKKYARDYLIDGGHIDDIEESNLGAFLKHIKKTGYPFQYVLDADLGEFLDSDELTSYSVETIYF